MPDNTITPRKGVRQIALTLGSKNTLGELLGATVFKGATTEVDKIAAYGDTAYTSVPRSVKSWDDFTFTVLDQGSNAADYKALEGQVVSVTVTPSYGSGDNDDATSPTTCKMVIQHVAPGGEISIDGETKSTIVITAVPHAPEAV